MRRILHSNVTMFMPSLISRSNTSIVAKTIAQLTPPTNSRWANSGLRSFPAKNSSKDTSEQDTRLLGRNSLLESKAWRYWVSILDRFFPFHLAVQINRLYEIFLV